MVTEPLGPVAPVAPSVDCDSSHSNAGLSPCHRTAYDRWPTRVGASCTSKFCATHSSGRALQTATPAAVSHTSRLRARRRSSAALAALAALAGSPADQVKVG